MSSIDVSVVVPVFNNAATLNELIDRLVGVLDGLDLVWELVCVDDGSVDDSFELLTHRAAADQRIRVFSLVRNFGSQAALCAGFDLVRGRRTVCIDADLENLPEDIPPLLAALDRGFDLACGVREGREGPLVRRRLPSMLFNAFVRRQIGTTVRDIGCGMRAMESSVVRNLAAEGEGRRLLTPLLLRRARTVVEVPIRWRPSNIHSRHSFFTLFGIAMDFYLLTAQRPFASGALISLAALTLGVVTLLAAALGGTFAVAFTGLVLLGSGFIGVLLALTGDYVQRLYLLNGSPALRELRAAPQRAPGDTPSQTAGDDLRHG